MGLKIILQPVAEVLGQLHFGNQHLNQNGPGRISRVSIVFFIFP